MELIKTKCGVKVVQSEDINLGLTLDCGQAFRWERHDDNIYCGIAYGKQLKIKKAEDGLEFLDTDEATVNNIWLHYFDLDVNHTKILSRLGQDEFIAEAIKKYGTIVILNQEPWETLCSFIISSCNNIPRIKAIIKRLCEAYGERDKESYSFPSAKLLATKTPEDLSFLKAGYRVPFILDAAKKVASEEIDLEKLKALTSEDARKELMRIKGVGKKVADCTMLFSLEHTNTYPVDRHIERATKEFYPNGLPEFFAPNQGLAQQYIFSYMLDNKK